MPSLRLLAPTALAVTTLALRAAPVPSPADAINQLGLDLLREPTSAVSTSRNALLSPYSIQSALALAFAGAEGKTREEMRRVMRLPADDATALDGLGAIDGDLRTLVDRSLAEANAAAARRHGVKREPIDFTVANRVYSQTDYPIRPEYLAELKARFATEATPLDFRREPGPARAQINRWVTEQTRAKIVDLIPTGGVNETTRAVLVNALYLRAPWEEPFYPHATEPAPFWIAGTHERSVPTMRQRTDCGYAEHADHIAVALPYSGKELQFVVLLPRERDGLNNLLTSLTAEKLAAAAKLPVREVDLHLPKFTIPGATLPLSRALAVLGMPTAFDVPAGSADFSRMAPRRPGDYLCFSEVFHQTYLALDERGTEAAAATAIAMVAGAAFQPKPPPPVVRVDRPFLFAIQHVPSGACLFLGWVNDPKS